MIANTDHYFQYLKIHEDGNCLIFCTDGHSLPIKIPKGVVIEEAVNIIVGTCNEQGIEGVYADDIHRQYFEAIKEYQSQQSKQKDKESQSNGEILMQLAIENIKLLFKDQHGVAHAVVRINDHNEVLPIENSRFRRYLGKLFWDKHAKVSGTESINSATLLLQAKTEYESETIPLSLRVAWKDESIYYDLTDEHWRSVKISKEGWEIINETPILFTRYKQTAQLEPDRNYEPGIMDKFIQSTNIGDNYQQLLVKVYIVTLFLPDIPHAILNLSGDKGSAKSMLFMLIKSLVDPSKPTLLTLHKDRNEFIQQVAHNWVAYYDNAKHVPDWLSDEVCRAATGGGHTKRKLYTDDDDIVYEYKRCLGFNGINISLTEEDALDRSILIDLVRIPNDKRKTEAEVLESFEQIKPQLLGYIFDTLVKALQIRPTIKLVDKPRMADFAEWGEAIARAMGYQPMEFLNAYYENIGKQNIEAVESHPLGLAIAKFVDQWKEGKTEWEGEPRELLELLEVIAQSYKIDTSHRNWPKAYNSLSRRLNQIKSNLQEGLNIKVTISRRTSGSRANTARIRIEKVSPKPPTSPAQEQRQLDGVGDAGDSGGNISSSEESEASNASANLLMDNFEAKDQPFTNAESEDGEK